jgi:hypothetical protein
VAVGAAVVALVAAPVLPPGLPVLVALLGLVFALPVPRPARRSRDLGRSVTSSRDQASKISKTGPTPEERP